MKKYLLALTSLLCSCSVLSDSSIISGREGISNRYAVLAYRDQKYDQELTEKFTKKLTECPTLAIKNISPRSDTSIEKEIRMKQQETPSSNGRDELVIVDYSKLSRDRVRLTVSSEAPLPSQATGPIVYEVSPPVLSGTSQMDPSLNEDEFITSAVMSICKNVSYPVLTSEENGQFMTFYPVIGNAIENDLFTQSVRSQLSGGTFSTLFPQPLADVAKRTPVVLLESAYPANFEQDNVIMLRVVATHYQSNAPLGDYTLHFSVARDRDTGEKHATLSLKDQALYGSWLVSLKHRVLAP